MTNDNVYFSGKVFSRKDIVTALTYDEIYLVYQPIVNTYSREIEAYEALARWDSKPRLGITIPPNVFMGLGGIAEMRLVTRTLMKKAEVAEQRLKQPIHFNISHFDLRTLPETTLTSLELVEDYFIVHSIPLVNKIAEKKDVWIDDFGAGACAWQYIPYLNITGIKIDGFLVKQLSEDNKYLKRYIDVLDTIANLANKWKILTIAEAVETEFQWKQLKKIGIDLCQGWFFYRPIELDLSDKE